MSLAKGIKKCQLKQSTADLAEDVKRRIDAALRVLQFDGPLDWEDREAASRALCAALSAINALED